MIKRKKVLLFSVFALCIIFAGTFWGRSVQATKFENNFKDAMLKGEYKEAIAIYSSFDNNSLFGKAFKTSNKAEDIVNAEIDKLKEQYINKYIDFNEFKGHLENIGDFSVINKELIKFTLNEVQKIEESRQVIKKAKKLLSEKEYNKALEVLNGAGKVEEKASSEYQALQKEIYEEYRTVIEADVDNLVLLDKLSEAEELMDEKRDILETSYIEKKTNEISGLLAKKEAEEKSKTEPSRSKRKQAELEAKLLMGYVASPIDEQFVSSYTSKTRFLIEVDISTQKTKIYLGEKGDWKLIKNYNCSTGAEGSETPKGTFSISRKGQWFYSKKYEQGAKYWVQFYGNYLFHSLPMDLNRNIVDPTLGTPASHGCVRLQVEEAKWLYENIPSGTKLIVK